MKFSVFALMVSAATATPAWGKSDPHGDAFRRAVEEDHRAPDKVAMFMVPGIAATPSGPGCPSSYADGCAGAPANGSYQLTASQFAAYAQVNGLTLSASLGIHPQPWNVACIDYACGIPSSSFNPSGYTLTPQGLKDGSIQANFTNDGLSNCVPNTTTHIVTCGLVTNPTIDGYDFSYTASGCMRLTFNGNSSGKLTIRNSYFRNSNGATLTASNCDVANGALISATVSTNGYNSITIVNNVIDGNGENFPFNMPQVVNINNAANANFTFEYNACLHLMARCGVVNSGLTKTVDYNIIIGMTYPPVGTYPGGAFPNTSGAHGEIFENGTSGTTGSAIEHEDFNTILTVNEHGTTGNRITSAIYLSDGGTNSAKWGTFTADNNTIVAPPSDGVNPNTVTLNSGGSGYADNDIIYTTPAGCGNFGPGIIVGSNGVVGGVIQNSNSNNGFFQGMTANGTAASGNGHCYAIPSNPVVQNTTTGSGTGASFNFSNWAQQSVGNVFVGSGGELVNVETKSNYIAVVTASTIASTNRPPCWSFAVAPSGTIDISGNVNWVTGSVITSSFSTGTTQCQ